LQGKENGFEVQHPTAELLEECPMLKIRHHQQSIFTAKENLLSKAFLPIAFEQAAEDLSPIFRFQANVMVDGIILCFTFNHMVVYGVGIWNVAKSLAACRD
jgi:fumigaclavine B O-acetyltransferase